MSRIIFVVDDDKNIARSIAKVLSSLENVDVKEFHKPVLALMAAQEQHPDVIVTDMMMPVMNGIDLVRSLRKEGVEAEVIFLTAYSKATFNAVLPTNRIRKVIQKPSSVVEIRNEVMDALKDG